MKTRITAALTAPILIFTLLFGACAVRKEEPVQKTMNQNAIHMLSSVTDTICDSFIITTEDGRVIVIDGGHAAETDRFIKYLQGVTGREKPHIDAWFLSHAHDDHCEVFLETVENRPDALSFDRVLLSFPPTDYYAGRDEWADTVLHEYARLKPRFANKEHVLTEGEVLQIGAAKITVLFADPTAFPGCNDGSVIFRMDLGGTSVLFTGDAGADAGRRTLEKWQDTGLLDCDYCKMAHHGQDGVEKDFYAAVSPEVCLWPTPSWVWDNTNGNLKTFETREWVKELGVRVNIVSMNGSRAIRLKPRIVTTTDVFQEGYPAEQAVERLAALGYEGVDMGFDYWTFEGSPFLGDAYLDWAKGLKERAEQAGVSYTHAHAPGEADADEYVERSIRAAAAMGARYLVIHPVWRDENGKILKNKKRFIDVNAAAIRKWLPLAEEQGVVLLSENLLWGASIKPQAIADLVKEVDSDRFGWCFDVGHAWANGIGPDALKKCAVAPMSVHIQDNDGTGDGHMNPGEGTVDFNAFTDALQSVGYLGDCVLEAHHQSLYAPDDERDAILADLLRKAQPIRSRMEQTD